MAEDFHVTNRYLSSVKSGYHLIKSYVKDYSSSTTTRESGVPSARAPSTSISTRIRPGSSRPPQSTKETSSSSCLTESVHLFPGWVTRQYVDNDRCHGGFNLHVHVSGYATSHHLLQTRIQRTFLRLAKGFAGMNKLAEAQHPKFGPASGPTNNARTSSVDDSSKENDIIHKLDESYNQVREKLDTDLSELPCEDEHPFASEPDTSDILQRWQNNLESRMNLFWPTMLSSRVVLLELFVSQKQQHHRHGGGESGSPGDSDVDKDRLHALGQFEVQTGTDGAFQHDVVVGWNDICRSPLAYCGLGEQVNEHTELVVCARLLPSSIVAIPPASRRVFPESKVVVALAHAPIRLISDIDDTVKMSNILGGARTVFRNVFVRDLEDTRIPGMGKWYTSMWEKGVRFHYVSNGPIQLLPVILNFLRISKLPHGSIKLKSYAARSIFNNLLTPPADRKRDGLVEILNSFSDSKFILVGDTGEQDLELYTQLSSAYPNKILAIFVRDVEPDASPIQDPTGKDWRRHVVVRSNTGNSTSSNGNGNAGSRSNSILPNVIRDRFSNNRFGAVGRTLSYSVNSPSPPSSSSIAEDDVPPVISSEPDPITPMDDRLSRARPIKKKPATPDGGTPWLSSSPTHFSSSPMSSSPLSQYEAVVRKSSLVLARGDSVEVKTASATVLKEEEEEEEGTNRRTITIAFADEVPISQSPDRASVRPSPRLPSIRHKPGTVVVVDDDGRFFRRPRTPRRNTTHQSSLSRSSSMGGSSGTNTPSLPPPHTSPSLLSLTRSRTQTEVERTADRKRSELQDRVWRARSEVPEGIVLRVFRDPSECVVETEGILSKR